MFSFPEQLRGKTRSKRIKKVLEKEAPKFENSDASSIDPDEPVLFVEVNLGEQGQKKIVVHEGDKVADLATAFALKYSKKDRARGSGPLPNAVRLG